MAVLSRQQGVTIIELMIVLVIMAILYAMAAPSFNRLVHNGRVETTANSLLIGLNTARTEAIRRGQQVSICAGNPATPACGVNWAQGWVIFPGTALAGNAIKVGTGDAATTTVGGTAPSQITFTSRGIIDASVPPVGTGTLIVNHTNCATGADKQLTLTISAVGRAIITSGTCP